MEVQVIVENDSINPTIKGKHGLSLLINNNDKIILYDFGPRNSLHKNAKQLSIDLETVDLAVLSHNHIDHGGDLNAFCNINSKAHIHVNTDLSDKLYTKLFAFINFTVGIKLLPENRKRIIIHDKSEEIARNVFILKLSEYLYESTLNNDLFVKKDNILEKE